MDTITEASGIASSRRNPGVLWTHNDGSKRKVFAVSTNGFLLASFDVNQAVNDVEDIAVGPGPGPGLSYLYLGDIGANDLVPEARKDLRILRVPEPQVDLSWAGNPRSLSLAASVESFSVEYPDGAFDAEALMLDPLSQDVLIATKQQGGSRIYTIHLPNIPLPAPLPLSFLRTISLADVSAGDISADGTRILLRKEESALTWARCDGEPISTALARNPKTVPVIGPPSEPNGEAIGFLPDNSGYITISEGLNPKLYFFASSCPMAAVFTSDLKNVSTYAGATVSFTGTATGHPAPTYSWRLNGQPLEAAGNTNNLVLSNVNTNQSGTYQLVASNALGTSMSTATLQVRVKPDLRITEVQSSTAPSPGVPTADWWELTSFEDTPVNLKGWKFNDNSGGFLDPFVFTNDIIIAPRESIILVEGLTLAQFQNWWGLSSLPTNLPVITYQGAGLSFAVSGDGIRLWSDVAGSEADTLARVDFGASANGVTFNYNPETGAFGQPSLLGTNGVFKASSSQDIGSPGRIRAAPPRPSLRADAFDGDITIMFQASSGYRYQLESRSSLIEGAWVDDGDPLPAATNENLSFNRVQDSTLRFYRLRVE